MKPRTDRRNVPTFIGVALLATLAVLPAQAAGAATSCEALQAQIAARIRAAGVVQFTLTTVDADARADGKEVGRCELGHKKIMYARGASAVTPVTPKVSPPVAPPTAPTAVPSAPRTRAAPSRPATEAILTECRDGTVSLGGDCKK